MIFEISFTTTSLPPVGPIIPGSLGQVKKVTPVWFRHTVVVDTAMVVGALATLEAYYQHNGFELGGVYSK
jgi:hypothetical protein